MSPPRTGRFCSTRCGCGVRSMRIIGSSKAPTPVNGEVTIVIQGRLEWPPGVFGSRGVERSAPFGALVRAAVWRRLRFSDHDVSAGRRYGPGRTGVRAGVGFLDPLQRQNRRHPPGRQRSRRDLGGSRRRIASANAARGWVRVLDSAVDLGQDTPECRRPDGPGHRGGSLRHGAQSGSCNSSAASGKKTNRSMAVLPTPIRRSDRSAIRAAVTSTAARVCCQGLYWGPDQLHGLRRSWRLRNALQRPSNMAARSIRNTFGSLTTGSRLPGTEGTVCSGLLWSSDGCHTRPALREFPAPSMAVSFSRGNTPPICRPGKKVP